ncbi:MAG: DNA polymerase III subunit beta [Syntrophomonadaceae bacterium]|nr:DNA polymerase III subunit beta [Syntrophomonadaceae bacterium]MDD3022946.1 DNA polymerase III subunit beta [Syntrophomonadaceae bacterium]
MKFTIEKKDLAALTSLVYRAAANKQTVPILSGLLLQVNTDKGLTMTATDMEIGIRVISDKIEVLEEGSVLVNAHYFNDLIKVLPDTSISLVLNKETSRLDINYGRSSGFINTYRDYEYPELPIKDMETKFSLPQEVLKEALKKTVFAASLTHFRQVFTGILFDIREGNIIKIVASDTHRLACYTFALETSVNPFNFIIPTRTANELLRILDDNQEPINIAFSENNVVFHKDNLVLLSRLIEGQYPNYEQVIPGSFNTSLEIKTSILANSLERARIMPSDDKLKIQHAKFNFREKEALVNTYSEMMGEIEEIIEDLNIKGDTEVKIAFNTNYFLDVVKILAGECEELSINLSGTLGPALIRNPQKENYIYVLVPLRVSN